MIKGEFYAGLPSEMMTRSRTVNRQETNFFWPDESKAESVTSRTKRSITKATPVITNNNNNDSAQSDINRKELVRKQLSSGIQFYDNVNAKTPEARRRRFKAIDNVNLNNNDVDFQPEKKKLETFSSKIEFYDFEPTETVSKPSKVVDAPKEEVKSKIESPDVKKRISFKTEAKVTTKSILKNSDEKPQVEQVLVKPLPKRGLLPKNLSKSVDNMSKLSKNVDETDTADKEPEKLSSIIKEVKSMNLAEDRNRKYDDYKRNERDSYDYRSPERNEPRRVDRDRDYYPRDNPRSSRYENRGYQDDYEYRDERGRNEPYRHDNRYGNYDDRNDRGYRYDRTQRVSYSQPREIYEYRERSRRVEESPFRERFSPVNERYDYDRDIEVGSRRGRSGPRDVKPITLKPTEINFQESPNRTIRYEEEYSSGINKQPKHIPQHLRTNILFNGRVRPQAQRPMSVRNSAVTRVGVGLPDIE